MITGEKPNTFIALFSFWRPFKDLLDKLGIDLILVVTDGFVSRSHSAILAQCAAGVDGMYCLFDADGSGLGQIVTLERDKVRLLPLTEKYLKASTSEQYAQVQTHSEKRLRGLVDPNSPLLIDCIDDAERVARTEAVKLSLETGPAYINNYNVFSMVINMIKSHGARQQLPEPPEPPFQSGSPEPHCDQSVLLALSIDSDQMLDDDPPTVEDAVASEEMKETQENDCPIHSDDDDSLMDEAFETPIAAETLNRCTSDSRLATQPLLRLISPIHACTNSQEEPDSC